MKWPLILILLLFPGVVYAHGAEHGGQAIEVQGYNLELATEAQGPNIHIHFYLMDMKDRIVTNAQIKLQVTTPDGIKIAQALRYNAKEQGYVGDLVTVAKGEYKVVVLTTIAGEKINARYTFKR